MEFVRALTRDSSFSSILCLFFSTTFGWAKECSRLEASRVSSALISHSNFNFRWIARKRRRRDSSRVYSFLLCYCTTEGLLSRTLTPPPLLFFFSLPVCVYSTASCSNYKHRRVAVSYLFEWFSIKIQRRDTTTTAVSLSAGAKSSALFAFRRHPPFFLLIREPPSAE